MTILRNILADDINYFFFTEDSFFFNPLLETAFKNRIGFTASGNRFGFTGSGLPVWVN
jgi:hypothetical protein